MKSPTVSNWKSVALLTVLLVGSANATSTAPGMNGAADAPKSAPTIMVISGDNQTGMPGEFNSKPFDIAVWNAAGTEPLVDTEVTFTVQSGGGLLASTKDTFAVPSYTLTLKTDQDGTVQAYYKQPFVPGLLSQIKAAAADGEILLVTTTLGVGESLDGTGLGTSKSTTSVKSGSGKGSGAGVIIGFAGSGSAGSTGGAGTKMTAHALTGLVAQVVLKTPDGNYAVNTSTWAISAYSGQ